MPMATLRSKDVPGNNRSLQVKLCKLQRRVKRSAPTGAAASGDKAPRTRLESIIRRKQVDLKQLIDDLGMEGMEEKLQGAITNPAQSQFQLGAMMSGQRAGVNVRPGGAVSTVVEAA